MNISKQWKRMSVWLPVAAAAIALAGSAGAQHVSAAPPPASCQGVKAANPAATDGNYAITTSGGVLTVFCKDMAGTPKEYLSLVKTGGAFNFSQYKPLPSNGTSVRTSYTKLRIDPATLRVNIADQSFATSTGSLTHGSAVVTSMPYGVAMSCTNVPDGLANVDLTGTPLAVANPPSPFVLGGANHAGTTSFAADDQIVNLTGGGFCGWNAPGAQFNPFNTNPLGSASGGWDLQLELLSFKVCLLFDNTRPFRAGSTVPVKLQVCDATGANRSAASIVVHATAFTPVSATVDGVVQDVGNANPDNDFRFDATLGGSGGYIFNLSTRGLAAGTYRLTFTVDGVAVPAYSVLIELR